jgi:hypothetical protein
VEVLSDSPINGDFAGSSHSGIFDPAYELIPLDDKVEVLSRGANTFMEDYGPCATRFGQVVVLGYSPYRFLGTVGKIRQMRELIRQAGTPVELDPVDPYDISRVTPWVRSDGKRTAILLINASLDPALPVDVKVCGSGTKGTILELDKPERSVNVVAEGKYRHVRIDGMESWEMKLLLIE